MAKPDGRIEKGQRIASAISARAWNRAQDAADIVLGVRPGVTAESPSYSSAPFAKVLMWWRQSNLDENRVFKPGYWAPLADWNVINLPTGLPDVWNEMPVVRPLSSPWGRSQIDRVAIALEPIRHNSYGHVAVSGICPARVNIINRHWRYVGPFVPHSGRVNPSTNANEGSWLLESFPFAGYRLLSRATEGERWALVDLNSWWAQPIVLGKTISSLEYKEPLDNAFTTNSSGSVELYLNTSRPTGIIVSARNTVGPLAENRWVWLLNPYATHGDSRLGGNTWDGVAGDVWFVLDTEKRRRFGAPGVNYPDINGAQPDMYVPRTGNS